MKTFARTLIALSAVLLLSLTLIPTSPATNARAFTTANAPFAPLDLSGELHGAPYRIRVPENWNGTLLVFAHGYRDKADHPGEVDNRNADVAPSGALEAPLLALGYALAGTAFKDNGWAIEDSIQDTKNLAVFFRDNVAKPDHTILWAVSLGTIGAFKSMEQFGGIFDGSLCLCAAGAGATRIWDNGLPVMLAYDVIFGMPQAWGTPGEVRNDLDFETEVVAKLGPELSNIANFPAFEFIRLVAGNPGRGLTPPPPPAFYPGWVLTDFFFLTEARAELQRRAGGPYVQNLDHNYSLTTAEKAYLAGLGVPPAVVDGWLAQMNARRNIAADPSARAYVRNNTDYNGKIRKPVLTLHTAIDPLVVVSNESAYATLIDATNREELLFQTYTNANGHCNFTGPQILTAVGAIDVWVRTGVRPTAASFPGGLGFNNAFVPPPMLQP
jgi:hypothetical protein